MARVKRVSLITLAAVGLTPGCARAAAAYFSGRIRGQSTDQRYMFVGLCDNDVTVRGDGDTDLDCRLYGPVVIHNYGNVYNAYIVRTTSH